MEVRLGRGWGSSLLFSLALRPRLGYRGWQSFLPSDVEEYPSVSGL